MSNFSTIEPETIDLRIADSRPGPPADVSAEQSVLGACLIDRAALETALDMLQPSDFYQPAHQRIFEAMAHLVGRGEPVDLGTLSTELTRRRTYDETGGVGYQAALADIVPTTANVAYYAANVFQMAQLRRMYEAGIRIAQWCYDREDEPAELIDRCETEILAVGERSVRTAMDGAAAQAEMVEDLRAGGRGLRWELETLNVFAGEMSDEEPTLIGALSGVGKSILARDEARGKCKAGLGVLIFSLEMSEKKFRQRIQAAEMGLSVRALRAGAKNPATAWVRDGSMDRTASAIGAWPLVIDDRGSLTVAQIAAKARRVKRAFARQGIPLALIVIDYAGLIDGDGRIGRGRATQDEYESTKRAAEAVRVMVKALRTPTLVLTQLTEEGQKRKGGSGDFPKVHSRDNRKWFHDAATVVWLHRPARDFDPGSAEYEFAKEKALLWVEKNRDGGGQGVVKIRWRDGIGGFLDPEHMPETGEAPPPQPAYADLEDEPNYGDPFFDEEDQ